MKTIRLMAFAAILFLIAAFHQAHAQTVPCLPALDGKSLTASPMYSGVSKNGAWVYWYCVTGTDTVVTTATGVSVIKAPVTPVIYVGTIAELAKVGGRIATITKAADPLRSLQTAGQRFPILPLTDPSLAAVVADMKAAMK